MSISKKTRQLVREKYNGLCAYTGKPLGDDWQVDHINPVGHYGYRNVDKDNISNLVPTIKIINHYKRCLDLEGFRGYMLYFHKRLAKLPKKTIVDRTARRKAYMFMVAELFDISVDKPFCGKFYFETL
jgi:hypothetical protein